MPFRIVLTGSTGNLGAYLLDALISDPTVEQVVCLNRAEDGLKKQKDAHTARGLVRKIDCCRVKFIRTDITAKRLGLAEDVYTELSRTIDLIIHNAWPVDFNRNVRSFLPFIEGINHIVEFCSSAQRANSNSGFVKLLFISSIGATSNWGAAAPSSRSHVPEAEIKDWKVARTGYGQSKLLSERLLCHASFNYSLPITVIRVGQLCGPILHGVQGKWPEHEWIPSIIKSSIALNALPRTLGPTDTVDWVPADVAAQVITEISTTFVRDQVHESLPKRGRKKEEPFFFHIVNPRTSQWEALVPFMTKRMPESVKLVPFVEWVGALKVHVRETRGLEKVQEGGNPAGKLLDFFDNLQDRAIRFPHARAAQLDTILTLKVSPMLRQLDAVNAEWMDLWMRQWDWLGTEKTPRGS